ncbi:MAG: hypothetical protein M1831_004361 [Alyxoria varia]|nr:MAG: hypothetical protein M1831_004361 [Alyxoria varia]
MPATFRRVAGANHKLAPKPACTHIQMVKVHDADAYCDICGNKSRIGWVYACEQDKQGRGLPATIESRKRFLNSNDHNNKSSPTNDLETCGVSEWVIKAASKGHYTEDQLTTLKRQKNHVTNIIADTMDSIKHSVRPKSMGSYPSYLPQPIFANSQTQKSATKLRRRTLSVAIDKKAIAEDKDKSYVLSEKSKANKKQSRSTTAFLMRSFQICEFKCCPTCRPLNRDRCWASFDSAIDMSPSDDIPWEPETMPVTNARVLKTIGLHSPPPTPVRSDIVEVGTGTEYSSFSSSSDSRGSGGSRESTADQQQQQQLENDEEAAANGAPLTRQKEPDAMTTAAAAATPAANNHDYYFSETPVDDDEDSQGFRESLRRMLENLTQLRGGEVASGNYNFSNFLGNNTDEEDGDADGDGEFSFADAEGAAGGAVDEKYEDAYPEGFNVELWEGLNEDLLLMAAGTPLPSEGAGDDDELRVGHELSVRERKGYATEINNDDGDLGNGVALTEEAAEMGSPDVVMRV